MRYVLGLNQYSHDAGACLLSLDGTRSLVIPNERLSRVKHDGGDTADAVRHALDAVGAASTTLLQFAQTITTIASSHSNVGYPGASH